MCSGGHEKLRLKCLAAFLSQPTLFTLRVLDGRFCVCGCIHVLPLESLRHLGPESVDPVNLFLKKRDIVGPTAGTHFWLDSIQAPPSACV